MNLPEEGDRFEWPPSIPVSASPILMTATDGPGKFGTTIYVDSVGYTVYGPQPDHTPTPPRARYANRAALLRDIRRIEEWR